MRSNHWNTGTRLRALLLILALVLGLVVFTPGAAPQVGQRDAQVVARGLLAGSGHSSSRDTLLALLYRQVEK
jgi:hypothetical protein